MNYNVALAGDFKSAAKSLAKKYPSLKGDLEALNVSLKKDPTQGNKIYKNTYKVRLAIASKGKGKSGGARVITHVITAVEKGTIYLLTIYDKSERSSISDKELKDFIESLK